MAMWAVVVVVVVVVVAVVVVRRGVPLRPWLRQRTGRSW